ncbi:hypothetical protein WN66_06118 [Saccharomyces cerevisiae]|uniref:Putative uncharacterized protein YOR277C n=2 Tax=Saccharomyces cerevisiae TaxID=4932 RepID=YO277_YEAST|nr:RecName: Full=Putative uncharacterized protein YOR277C [Saccharomyces cerevisiae S288C]KZV08164.1 hypothetical protein WN66_06118 [Saccharomyces cerevisiae]CAA99502.1 unnamed protein product [Saccharomyces cerevisiae]CAY86556.1 EC1118_1O4_5083p [Saccharomyces cerevisiae EC1118]
MTYASSSSSSLSKAANALKPRIGLSATISLVSAGLLEEIFLLFGLTFKVSWAMVATGTVEVGVVSVSSSSSSPLPFFLASNVHQPSESVVTLGLLCLIFGLP